MKKSLAIILALIMVCALPGIASAEGGQTDNGTLEISKTVTVIGKELSAENLPGSFKFKVKQGDEEKATVTVTKDGNTYKAETVKLEPGAYTVEEVVDNAVEKIKVGDDTYELQAPEAQSVTIEAGTKAKITFKNEYWDMYSQGVIVVKKAVESDVSADKNKEF